MSHAIISRYPPNQPAVRQKLRAKDWPVLIDRLGLGWLLGRHFLVVTHRGRRSGLIRQTGVMVLHEDRRTGEVCVAAGTLNADWYRNVQAQPAPEVAIAGRRFCPVQRFVPPEELAAHIAWVRQHSPVQAWIQSRFFGWPWTTAPDQILELAQSLGGVAFMPTQIVLGSPREPRFLKAIRTR
jgi:deazaflavin-dependent oxidoreductase (nitroreductase family)